MCFWFFLGQVRSKGNNCNRQNKRKLENEN